MKSEDEVSKTNNNNAHKLTNVKQIKNTNKPQNNSQYKTFLWNQNKYQVGKLDQTQTPTISTPSHCR